PESGGGTYRHRVPRRFPGFAPTLTGRSASRADQAGPAWVAGPTGGGWLPAGRHPTPDRWSGEEMIQDRPQIIAFHVDTEHPACLRQAFPEWEVEATNGATSDSLEHDWSPAAANLLVVAARARVAETLGLCRGLRSQAGRAQTPLLVLVPPDQEALV